MLSRSCDAIDQVEVEIKAPKASLEAVTQLMQKVISQRSRIGGQTKSYIVNRESL